MHARIQARTRRRWREWRRWRLRCGGRNEDAYGAREDHTRSVDLRAERTIGGARQARRRRSQHGAKGRKKS